MTFKTRITKCYLVEVTDEKGNIVFDNDGVPIDTYVFGNYTEAQEQSKRLIQYAKKLESQGDIYHYVYDECQE